MNTLHQPYFDIKRNVTTYLPYWSYKTNALNSNVYTNILYMLYIILLPHLFRYLF